MMDEKALKKRLKLVKRVRFWTGLASRLCLTSVGLVLLAKVAIENQTGVSFSDEPIDLWIGLCVAVLMIEKGTDPNG
jgi:hypothetical protein